MGAGETASAVLDLGAVGLPLQAEELFGDARPFEVELGCGKGRFAVEWAAAHPEIGLLTVERARVYLMPENPDFPPIEITQDTEFVIWGVVTSVIHKV